MITYTLFNPQYNDQDTSNLLWALGRLGGDPSAWKALVAAAGAQAPEMEPQAGSTGSYVDVGVI